MMHTFGTAAGGAAGARLGERFADRYIRFGGPSFLDEASLPVEAQVGLARARTRRVLAWRPVAVGIGSLAGFALLLGLVLSSRPRAGATT